MQKTKLDKAHLLKTAKIFPQMTVTLPDSKQVFRSSSPAEALSPSTLSVFSNSQLRQLKDKVNTTLDVNLLKKQGDLNQSDFLNKTIPRRSVNQRREDDDWVQRAFKGGSEIGIKNNIRARQTMRAKNYSTAARTNLSSGQKMNPNKDTKENIAQMLNFILQNPEKLNEVIQKKHLNESDFQIGINQIIEL